MNPRCHPETRFKYLNRGGPKTLFRYLTSGQNKERRNRIMNDVTGIGSGLKAIGQAITLLVVFLFFVGIVMGLMAYHIASEHLPRNNNKTIEAQVKTDHPQLKVNQSPAKPKEVEAPPESGPSDGGEI